MTASGYLLDTNVISETSRRRPEPSVIAYLRSLEPEGVHLSVLTLGELRRGAAKKRLRDLPAAAEIDSWVDLVELTYANRVLPVTLEIARLWGEWSAVRSRPIVDTLLAATAAVHGLVLISRNTIDFSDLPITLVNPWPT